MADLLAALTRAVEGAGGIAIAAAFVWGILSIVLSPCHLASIPLIVAFVGQSAQSSTRRAFTISSLFAVGILISIAIVAVLTSVAGRMLGDVGPYGNYFVAFVFLIVGLIFIDVLPAPWSPPSNSPAPKRGLLGAFVLGLVFGIALGPCTFAYMAPVLAVTFKMSSTHFLYASALTLAYGVGHCSVIVLAGTSSEIVQRYLDWNERSRGALIVKRVCGVLVILGALYLIYAAP